MAVLSLPLSFTNSFWSQGYRKGLEVLYEKLEQGVAENDEVITFIRTRANLEGQLAASLTNPPQTGPASVGFSSDDGASLLMAFRGLQAESIAQGQAHLIVSKELHSLVADPFTEWAQVYKDRLRQNKLAILDEILQDYELAQVDVAKLKQQYLAKTRRADEAEDDAKFAPVSSVDTYTSPRVPPADKPRAPPQRTPSVSQRIANRLKEIQKRSVEAIAAAAVDDLESSPETTEKSLPPNDKGKGKEKEVVFTAEPEVMASPPPLSPLSPAPVPKLEIPAEPAPPATMILAGVSFPVSAVSKLMVKAAAEIKLRPVRFPLLGEYQDCFTGEDFAAWLNDSVPGFGGDLDVAEDAARELTERENLLRRIGELGNQFEHSDEAWYQFRPKAFDIEGNNQIEVKSPIKAVQQNNIFKQTNSFVSLVSKAIANANSSEPAHVRARQEADEADREYRIAVRKLDRQRLGLEERVEETLKTLQRWELERLGAVKTVLLQYQGTLANLPKSLETSLERSSTLISAYQPEGDLSALIERYRTGPFRPEPQVYESVAHDESDVVFGLDLRKWAEGGWYTLTAGEEKRELVPPIFTALIAGLQEAYTRLPSDDEKRKAWIYEVPLPASHHLREALNGVPADHPIPIPTIVAYDAPVIASTIKLWFLELNPPISLYEGWDDFRKLYPTVGALKTEDGNLEQHLKDLSTALLKLPRVHLFVLDGLVKHLRELIDNTSVEETDEVYITKLALSIGRSIIRPRTETQLSIQDRHPTLLFMDLVKHYHEILPPTITRKKRESERKVPLRKRTAPIDMRLSRSRISSGADTQQLLAAQQIAQNPSLAKSRSDPPPVPPLPSSLKTPPPPPPIVPTETAPAPPPVVAAPPPPPPPLDAPARPSFKEPAPESDETPRRPTFKEPPPEPADTPPRPKFAEPAKSDEEEEEDGDDDDDDDNDEEEEEDGEEFEDAEGIPEPPKPAAAVPPPPPPIVQQQPPPPPPPLNAPTLISPARGPPGPPPVLQAGRSGSTSNPYASRFASAADPSLQAAAAAGDDIVLGSGRVSLNRSGSGHTAAGGAAGVRGPRLSRAGGPRAPSGNTGGPGGGGGGGGGVRDFVSNLNRNNASGRPAGGGT